MSDRQKTINLALQGGGAHGAFTRGVLDRFLEDGRVKIEAISGTSAGAINAVVLADGFARGGAQGARDRLRMLWDEVGRAAALSPIQRGPFSVFTGDWNLDTSLGYFFFDAWGGRCRPTISIRSISIRCARSSRARWISKKCGPASRSSCSCRRPMSRPAVYGSSTARA
jgi:hypothetical protein